MSTLSIPGGGSHSVGVYGNSTVFAGNGNDTIAVSGGTGYVQVGSGKDEINLYSNGTVIAGDGKDTINLSSWNQYGSVNAGNGNDSINLAGYGDIKVGSGKDTINLAQSGTISQVGASGHDTINVGYGTDTVYAEGHATVTGPFGSAQIAGGEVVLSGDAAHTLSAPMGDATLFGGQYSNVFVGGTGSVVMHGGQGPDTFIGGSGLDTMIAGSNTNEFEFLAANAGGNHIIQNFVKGEDQLYLEGKSFAYWNSQGDITSDGKNTFISLDNGHTTIELKGVTGIGKDDVTTHK